MDTLIADERILFGEDETQIIQVKEYVKDYEGKLSSVIALDSRAGANEMEELFGDRKVFPQPKPVGLLREIAGFCLQDSDLGLDFFAGSGTTAHAVLDLNKRDGGSRRFILVQLPEPTGRTDYPIISDIMKERVRRVIKKLGKEHADELELGDTKKQDRGFAAFTLAESNFRPWNAESPVDAGDLTKQLELHVDHIRDGRTPSDLLYEILLKSGFPLTTRVEALSLAGKTIQSVAGGALFICLERELTLELIRAIAEARPERVVCLDEGFAGNDQLKANAVQIFKTKGVTSFKTI